MIKAGFVLLGSLSASIGIADDHMTLFSTECEEALALSALPARLRDDVTTYVLKPQGYRVSKRGDGPFTCLVTHNHPDSIIPVCFDRAGTDAIVPTELRRGEMILGGDTVQDFMVERTKKAETGELAEPKPGVSYMVSDYNYIYAPPAAQLFKIDAHMMYYAPNMTDDDIGGSQIDGTQNKGMPFMNDPGIHGMMIAYVEQASDSSDVQRQCSGQLPPEPPAPPASN